MADELSTLSMSERGGNIDKKATSPHLCWAEIDLDAIVHNVRGILSLLPPKVELMAVVKADGYGLGAVPVSMAALKGGAIRLGVASVDEAEELRDAGIVAPILVLGYILDAEADRVVDLGVVPTVAALGLAQRLNDIGRDRRIQIPVHIKIDTGMGRFGLMPDEVEPLLRSIGDPVGLRFEGIFSHFATADMPDKTAANLQLEKIVALVGSLKKAGHEFKCVHMSNSAATLALPRAHLDMVRCGLAILGNAPGGSGVLTEPPRPALTLKSRVVQVRKLPTGSGVGYGHIFTTDHPTDIALVPIGYGDGVRRAVADQGSVLIRGRRSPLVGRVSMGYVTVDVDGLGVEVDDEVVLIGRQGDEEISAEEVAAWSKTIVYEVFTGLSTRLPRTYRGFEQSVQ